MSEKVNVRRKTSLLGVAAIGASILLGACSTSNAPIQPTPTVAPLPIAASTAGANAGSPAPIQPTPTVAPLPVATSNPATLGTTIELPDGTACLFAGKGATLSFAGKRVNYTCKSRDGGQVVLLGDPAQEADTLTVEKAILGRRDSAFFVEESQLLSMQIARVELADGSVWANAGRGATLAFNGKRLNFTSQNTGGPEAGLLGEFTQQDGLWTAQRVTFGRTDNRWVIQESAWTPITKLVGVKN